MYILRMKTGFIVKIAKDVETLVRWVKNNYFGTIDSEKYTSKKAYKRKTIVYQNHAIIGIITKMVKNEIPKDKIKEHQIN